MEIYKVFNTDILYIGIYSTAW